MPDAGQQPRAVPCDYDTDPGRWVANQGFRPPGTGLFGKVTQRIIAGDAVSPVLELGGGTGPLARELAQNAAQQVGRFFEITGTESWDVPLIELATADDVRRYLRGRGLAEDAVAQAAARVAPPLRLTKRGTLIWARAAA